MSTHVRSSMFIKSLLQQNAIGTANNKGLDETVTQGAVQYESTLLGTQGPVQSFNTVSGLPDKGVLRKIIFAFLNQNICCGYSKDPSH